MVNPNDLALLQPANSKLGLPIESDPTLSPSPPGTNIFLLGSIDG